MTEQTTRKGAYAAGHSVRWWLDRDSIYGDVFCHEPPNAICRMACPHGCDAWPCGHELEQVSVCSAVEWFHLDGDVEQFFGGDERVPLRDGPIHDAWLSMTACIPCARHYPVTWPPDFRATATKPEQEPS
jgi:hypothetical protein